MIPPLSSFMYQTLYFWHRSRRLAHFCIHHYTAWTWKPQTGPRKPQTVPLLHSTLQHRLESRRLSHCCIQLYSIDLKAPQTGPLLHSTLIFATKVTNRPTSAFNFTFLTKTKSERRCLAHCGSKTEHHGLVYWSIYSMYKFIVLSLKARKRSTVAEKFKIACTTISV